MSNRIIIEYEGKKYEVDGVIIKKFNCDYSHAFELKDKGFPQSKVFYTHEVQE